MKVVALFSNSRNSKKGWIHYASNIRMCRRIRVSTVCASLWSVLVALQRRLFFTRVATRYPEISTMAWALTQTKERRSRITSWWAMRRAGTSRRKAWCLSWASTLTRHCQLMVAGPCCPTRIITVQGQAYRKVECFSSPNTRRLGFTICPKPHQIDSKVKCKKSNANKLEKRKNQNAKWPFNPEKWVAILSQSTLKQTIWSITPRILIVCLSKSNTYATLKTWSMKPSLNKVLRTLSKRRMYGVMTHSYSD